MTDELNRLLARAGIETTMQAARLFRRDKSAFSLLTRGERAISPELEALVRLLATGKIAMPLSNIPAE